MRNEASENVHVLKAHVALNVHSVVESTEFYQKMLGLEPSKVRAGYAKFDVENPPLSLTLNENSFTERGALWHMGIQVAATEDVLAIRERWLEEGLATRDQMQIVCGYALQDKTWVADPDGNQWEAFVVLKDNVDQAVGCPAGACPGDDDTQHHHAPSISTPATVEPGTCR